MVTLFLYTHVLLIVLIYVLVRLNNIYDFDVINLGLYRQKSIYMYFFLTLQKPLIAIYVLLLLWQPTSQGPLTPPQVDNVKVTDQVLYTSRPHIACVGAGLLVE